MPRGALKFLPGPSLCWPRLVAQSGPLRDSGEPTFALPGKEKPRTEADGISGLQRPIDVPPEQSDVRGYHPGRTVPSAIPK